LARIQGSVEPRAAIDSRDSAARAVIELTRTPSKRLNPAVGAKATLGLVLSGGGARGIAHIGVIDALRSHDIEPDAIAGSSSGAIIGALAAAGHSTETMLEFFQKASPFRLSVVTVRKAGILDTAKVVASFREYFPEDSWPRTAAKLPSRRLWRSSLVAAKQFHASSGISRLMYGSSASVFGGTGSESSP
jgi:predicted acylesterase/phospholipase RssA